MLELLTRRDLEVLGMVLRMPERAADFEAIDLHLVPVNCGKHPTLSLLEFDIGRAGRSMEFEFELSRDTHQHKDDASGLPSECGLLDEEQVLVNNEKCGVAPHAVLERVEVGGRSLLRPAEMRGDVLDGGTVQRGRESGEEGTQQGAPAPVQPGPPERPPESQPLPPETLERQGNGRVEVDQEGVYEPEPGHQGRRHARLQQFRRRWRGSQHQLGSCHLFPSRQ